MPCPPDATPIAFNDSGQGWHLAPRRRHLQRALALAGVALVLYLAVNLWSEVSPWAAAPLLLGCGLGVAILLEPRPTLSARMHESVAEYGLLLPVHPAKISQVLMLALLGLACLVGPVAGVLAGTTSDLSIGVAVAVLGFFLLGLLFLGGAVGGAAGRRHPSRGLLLTVDGVVLHTQKPAVRFAWHQCAGLRAHWTRVRGVGNSVLSPEDRVVSWLTFEVDPEGIDGTTRVIGAGTAEPTVDVALLAVPPRLAIEVCRYYLTDAEARAELRTVEALDRVAAIERELDASA